MKCTELRAPSAVPYGLSDLATDVAGHLFVLPERYPGDGGSGNRAIFPMVLRGDGGAEIGDALGFQLPEPLDTEALAPLGNGRFAVGTERHSPAGPPSDEVFFLAPRRDGGFDLSTVEVQYPGGIAHEGNHGIEGMCGASGRLLVSLEYRQPDGHGGVRAPLIERSDDPSNDASVMRWLSLRTTAGKVSAMACRDAGQGLDVVAVERGLNGDISETMLLWFRIDESSKGLIQPTSVLDLPSLPVDRSCEEARRAHGFPNIEGISWLDHDSMLLVTDNDYKTREEATWLIVVERVP